jgi:serpin B
MKRRIQTLTLLLLLAALVASACAPATAPPRPSPLATPEPGQVPAPDPANGRDAALAYLGQHYDLALPPDPAWDEEVVTPDEAVGAHAVEYTTGGSDATVEVSMPVVAPQNVVYTVVVDDPATGLRWEGKVDAYGNVTETDLPLGERETAPQVAGDDLQDLAAGNSAFAFDLFQALRGEEGNLFYSPYSISVALAMTYAGARNETETEMADTLHFSLPQERLHPAFNGLDLELVKRAEGAEGLDEAPGEPGEGFRLNIANALWGQEGYPFLPQFLDLLARNYGAGMRLVDFMGDVEAARVTINDWVSEQTEGKIEDLIPPGMLDATTRLVLTNAIYFNAAWADPFEELATSDGPFYLLDGSQVTASLMQQTETFGYARGDGYQLVELPYSGHEMSMVILLPDEGGYEAFEEGLDASTVEAMLNGASSQRLNLTMPRFEFDDQFSLGETLADMGMPLAFSNQADFSGMTGQRDLFISAVVHKAFVAVDEQGTEAAAATAVGMAMSAIQADPAQVRIDRPFVFFIRDIQTGTILFVGRVLDPTS